MCVPAERVYFGEGDGNKFIFISFKKLVAEKGYGWTLDNRQITDCETDSSKGEYMKHYSGLLGTIWTGSGLSCLPWGLFSVENDVFLTIIELPRLFSVFAEHLGRALSFGLFLDN